MIVIFTFSVFFFPMYIGVPGGRPDFFDRLIKRRVTMHPMLGFPMVYLYFFSVLQACCSSGSETCDY